MARRKNTRRFDPRYFMDEKTDIIKEEVETPPVKNTSVQQEELEEVIDYVLGEATRADYYECLEKVPQMYSANSSEFGKCLNNPSAYKPPKSKRRTLDDIPDIGVSRTGGPRPKNHPFNKYNPRDYDRKD